MAAAARAAAVRSPAATACRRPRKLRLGNLLLPAAGARAALRNSHTLRSRLTERLLHERNMRLVQREGAAAAAAARARPRAAATARLPHPKQGGAMRATTLPAAAEGPPRVQGATTPQRTGR